MTRSCLALPQSVEARLQAARDAAAFLRLATAETKNRVLLDVARLLKERERFVLDANAEDLMRFDHGGGRSGPAFRDRLLLSPARLAAMIESLRAVAALPDPVGEVIERRELANGLRVSRVRAPLGVVFLIFESRPNVAVEAFSLTLKSGNALILRGGRESASTAAALYPILEDALRSLGFPASCVFGITDPDRALVDALLSQDRLIDVVIPRGSDRLIELVTERSRIPVIRNDRGMCHVYVHADADPAMAMAIVENAKTQRPGVCNAMETLLVHKDAAQALLPPLYARISGEGATSHPPVEWLADIETTRLLSGRPRVRPADSESWDTEHLDYEMNCRVVGSLEEALEHIARHTSRHSEAIVASSEGIARRFQAEVDAAAVYWNASTRFTDGFELGLGAEIGISTQKLHVRGPVGLRELTSPRWVVDGSGQVRG